MEDDPSPDGRITRRVLGPILLAGAAVAMASRTRGGWSDPLVDFGREAYVPWQLMSGRALFTDIAWFNGPLSQYWNAFLFRLFGPGISVLVGGNAVVLVVALSMCYLLLARVADHLSALVGGLVFILVFAFGQYVGIGNYNWITPYSHELTHGIVLALAAMVGLDRGRRRESLPATALGGLALGLSFLTKVEPFLAGAAASVVLLLPAVRAGRARAAGVFVGTALIPIVVSSILVGPTATLGPWPSVLAGDVSDLAFYRTGMGLDLPGLRLAEMSTWAAIWGLVFALPLAVAWLARETRTPLMPWLSAGVFSVPLILFADAIPWRDVMLPLPLLLGAVAIPQIRAWWRADRGLEAATPLAFTVFGAVLLLKMILRVRIAHYGFALALPATLVLVAALVTWVPRWLESRGMRGDVFRACSLALLAAMSMAHVATSGEWMARKTTVVAVGRDAFRADARGAFVNAAVDYLGASGATTAAVVPEGIMINYLARIPNPTPYLNFMPPEEIMFGDEAWTEAFMRSPPDVVLIVPKDTSEFGRGQFGSGYGTALTSWIDAHYRLDRTLRVEGYDYEVAALVRRDPDDADVKASAS